ncbi:hypothetical protein PT974_05245 [Cladobotryum mycophilum]|uniref:Peptidase M61 catalytic domain-containing protein n=1 Tax=Cladobotryum mycophilum TaxID=491253 RepID=A0ABR0SI71_9HYPO
MGEYFIDPHIETPSFDLTLTPAYSTQNHNHDLQIPIGIDVTMRLKVAYDRFTRGSPFLVHSLNRGPTETARYDSDAITASHSSGRKLSLRYDDNKKGGDVVRTWYLIEAPTEQNIVVRFFAPARKTDKTTQSGPRIDLRKDVGGGLVGQGDGFIPIVPDLEREGSSVKPEEWDVSVQWHLGGAPEGTKGAWSLGDEVISRTKRSLESAISQGIFAVGHLERYPSWSSSISPVADGDPAFAMYWLGNPPFDMNTIPPTTAALFRSIASFFSSQNPFRVFIRQVETGSGGTGATDSFLYEYSSLTWQQETMDSLVDLLAHEIVHEYSLLDSKPSPADDQQELESAWYNEGIASYYGAIASFRGGAISRGQLIQFLNGYAQAYYTSPVRGMNYGDVLRQYWDNVHFLRVSYWRGFLYLAAENGRIAAATNGGKSLDNVVLDLYRRRLQHEPHDLKDYRSLVAGILGKEAETKNYDAMYGGDLVIPSEDCFASLGLKLIRRDAEMYELGCDINGFSRQRIVKDLVKDSRAEKAGLREGDKLVDAWMVWTSADSLNGMMQATVSRDDQDTVIRWWPRSYKKVECYAWVEDGTEESMAREQ